MSEVEKTEEELENERLESNERDITIQEANGLEVQSEDNLTINIEE